MSKQRLKFNNDPGENDYYVENNKDQILGVIIYYDEWKKWVWEQYEDIIMSWDCLQEVVDYMKTLKKPKKK